MGTKLVERGITRYDIHDQGTFGCMVRISRAGEHTNEFFSDAKYRGKRKALAASRYRYSEWVSQLPPPKTTKGNQTQLNQTDVVGVQLAVCESTYGKLYSSYCASWKETNGFRRKIIFPLKNITRKSLGKWLASRENWKLLTVQKLRGQFGHGLEKSHHGQSTRIR